MRLRNYELNIAIKDRDFDEIYGKTVELLNWLVNTNELLFHYNKEHYEISRQRNPKINGIILGLRQAYNSFKHNMEIISLEKVEHKKIHEFKEDQFYLEEIVWLPSRMLEDTKNGKKLFMAYQKYLEGKSIRDTFKKVVEFLTEESQKIT